MTYRIIGRRGSGKTEYMFTCLKELQSTGVDCLFLVPEQQSLEAELMLEKRSLAHLNTEVLNFERLPNRVFREIGGLYGNSLDSAGKCVLMARAFYSLKEELSFFKKLSRGTLSELCATVSSLKRLCVSPDMFKSIAKEAE